MKVSSRSRKSPSFVASSTAVSYSKMFVSFIAGCKCRDSSKDLVSENDGGNVAFYAV